MLGLRKFFDCAAQNFKLLPMSYCSRGFLVSRLEYLKKLFSPLGTMGSTDLCPIQRYGQCMFPYHVLLRLELTRSWWKTKVLLPSFSAPIQQINKQSWETVSFGFFLPLSLHSSWPNCSFPDAFYTKSCSLLCFSVELLWSRGIGSLQLPSISFPMFFLNALKVWC